MVLLEVGWRRRNDDGVKCGGLEGQAEWQIELADVELADEVLELLELAPHAGQFGAELSDLQLQFVVHVACDAGQRWRLGGGARRRCHLWRGYSRSRCQCRRWR